MVSTFNDKFRQDLEIIYAKYSHPFDDAPEFILNTCDLPENVKLIESYKYSNCGKWKVSGNSVCENDNNSDDECSFDDLFTSDEENQHSSYESDDNSSVSSECSGSFQLQKSFRDKHPRSCAKANPDSKLKSSNVTLKKSRSTTDVNHGTTTQSRRKVHDSAPTQLLNNDHEDGHRNTDMTLARNAGCSCTEEDNFKPSATVTISKDLWSEVERCLRLMTSFFSQFNSDCSNESSDNNCNRKLLHKERSEHSISSSIVKQELFHDVTSKFRATIPQGQVVEKLFVRRKGSEEAGVELASRQTFLSHSNSKISEDQSVDSGFCRATENSSDVDVLTHGCTASSASRFRVDALPSHKIIVNSGTSEEYCNEALYLKSPLVRPTVKSVHGSKPSSFRRSLHETGNDLHPTSTKKRRRRYRLVRRRSSCGTTRRKLTTDRARSEHEQEYETPFQDTRHVRHVAKSGRIVDRELPESDTENFRTYAKDEKTTLENNEHMSPDMDEVILLEAPSTPALAEIRATPESLQEHCRSSTPRKQIYSRVNNSATNPRDPDTYLKTSSFKRCSDIHLDLIPSPIKPVLTPNTHQTDTLSKSSERFINAPKDSLLDSSKRSMPRPIFLPEILVDFMKTEDIHTKSFVSSEGKLNTRNNGESCTIQDHCRYPKTLFASSTASNKRRSSSSSHPSPTHDDVNHHSKQIKNPKKKFLPNDHSADDQHVNLIATAFNVDEKLPARPRQVRDVCHPATDSDQAIEVLADEQSRPRSEQCATDRQVLISPKTPVILNNMKDSLTMTQSSNNIERKGEQATSEKRKRYSYDSGKLISPVRSSENQRQRRFIEQKITTRRAKFHPYAAYHKFLRSSSLSSTFQDLTIKSPTLSCSTHRWTTLDRSPVALCVRKARRMPDSVYASRKILDFSSNEIRYSPTKKINSVSRTTKLTTTESDVRIKDDDTSSCSSSGKCTKTFCFNCSMDFS